MTGQSPYRPMLLPQNFDMKGGKCEFAAVANLVITRLTGGGTIRWHDGQHRRKCHCSPQENRHCQPTGKGADLRLALSGGGVAARKRLARGLFE